MRTVSVLKNLYHRRRLMGDLGFQHLVMRLFHLKLRLRLGLQKYSVWVSIVGVFAPFVDLRSKWPKEPKLFHRSHGLAAGGAN